MEICQLDCCKFQCADCYSLPHVSDSGDSEPGWRPCRSRGCVRFGLRTRNRIESLNVSVSCTNVSSKHFSCSSSLWKAFVSQRCWIPDAMLHLQSKGGRMSLNRFTLESTSTEVHSVQCCSECGCTTLDSALWGLLTQESVVCFMCYFGGIC
jgi:hypothetical protein